AGASVGVIVGMATDDVRAADAALEDVAVDVDDVVVADITPLLGDAVIVVDRADGVVPVGAVVDGSMVHDRVLDLLVLERPDHAAAGEAPALVRAPLRAGDDRGRHRRVLIHRGDRCGAHHGLRAVLVPRAVGGVDIGDL